MPRYFPEGEGYTVQEAYFDTPGAAIDAAAGSLNPGHDAEVAKFDAGHDMGDKVKQTPGLLRENRKFRGYAKLAEALEAARRGIDAKVSTFALNLDTEGRGLAPVIVYDVVGGSPDVGRIAVGAPDCMMRRAKRPSPLMVTIAVNSCCSWSVPKSALQERGRKVLAAVRSIEEAGARCRVLVVNTSRTHDSPARLYMSTIQVKGHGEQADPQALAFWISDPGALRWISFRHWVQLASKSHTMGALGWSLGQPSDPQESWVREHCDIYFEALKPGQMPRWEDTAESMAEEAIKSATARRAAGITPAA